MQRPDPYANTCRLEFDLPWELAQALLPVVTELAAVLTRTLAERTEVRVHADERKAETDRAAEANRAAWRALAADCESEIRRRANGPGSRRSIVRQLAAERNLSFTFLERIVRVYRREERQLRFATRANEARALRDQGKSTEEISRALGVSGRMVRKYLEGYAAGRPHE